MNNRPLPTGTVTYLFTDIEGSTRLVQSIGDKYVAVLEAHNQIIGDAITAHGGFVLQTEGDSFFAVFDSAVSAITAALRAQLGLLTNPWPDDVAVNVRMGVHSGEGALGGANYVGIDVNRASRIADAAHGGQTVMSEATAVLAERTLDPEVVVRDLGKHRLKDLSEPEAIYQISAPGLPDEFPPLRTLDAVPNNLPMQVTTFIGRDDVLRQAKELMSRSRLLTLTGPGGTGKTRLSLQVAAEMADRFSDGVFFVGLSPITDHRNISSAVLSAMGLQVSSKDEVPDEHLLDQLDGKQLLMVLDNFEQVLDGAPLVASMVQRAPRSKFLVSSRAPLRVSGEQEMPVPPMRTKAASVDETDLTALGNIEAVKLFVERARSVRPDFDLTAENAAAVVELVDRLDGLPLAIELVASRVRLMNVNAILDRLDLKMMRSGNVDLPERQQTIDGAISWSYDLLDEPVRRLFDGLSVFAGGGRLDEIEYVMEGLNGVHPDVLEGLAVLVDHSLLRSGDGVAGQRFRMLHVIREYAMSRLEEGEFADQARKRHLEAYVALAERAAPEMLRKDRRMWLDALEQEHDNIRAALDWGMGREVDLVLRLVAASWRFWQARGHLHEARAITEAALAQSGGSARWRAKALEALGGILWWQGDMDESRDVYRDAVDLQREVGDPKEIANALYNYAMPLAYSGTSPEQAGEALIEAEGIYRDLGDVGGLGDVAWGKGDIELFLERYQESVDHFLESAEYYEESGNEFGLGWAKFQIAGCLVRMGRPMEAWPHIKDGLKVFAGHRDMSAVTIFMALAAAVASDLGLRDRALRLGGAFHSLRIATGTDLVIITFNMTPGLEFETLEALEGDEADAYRFGKSMTVEEAIAFTVDWEPGGPSSDGPG